MADTPERHRTLMLEVLKQFRVLLRAMDAHYRSVERRVGLGGAQLWALSEIGQPKGLTMGELAERLAIHLSTASNLVSRLEALKLVTRYRAPGDRRVVRLAITPAGRRQLRKAPRPSAGLLQETLLELPTSELRALRRQLDGVLRRMERVDMRAASTPLGQILGHDQKLLRKSS